MVMKAATRRPRMPHCTASPAAEVQPWTESTVPTEHSLLGFHSVTAALEGHEQTAKLLTELQSRSRALAVVLMRDPYDADMLAPGVLGVTAYGFRKCQLDAVIARLVQG